MKLSIFSKNELKSFKLQVLFSRSSKLQTLKNSTRLENVIKTLKSLAVVYTGGGACRGL